MSREKIVRDRQKRGLCTTCVDHQTQCIERAVSRGGCAARIIRIIRKVALTPRNEKGCVKDEVCLRCNPPAARTAAGLSCSCSSGRQEQQRIEGGMRIERNATEESNMIRGHASGTTSRRHHTSGGSDIGLRTSGSGLMASGLGSAGTGPVCGGSDYHGSGSGSENEPHHFQEINHNNHSIAPDMAVDADCAVVGAPTPSSAGSITSNSTLLEHAPSTTYGETSLVLSSPRTTPEADADTEAGGRHHQQDMNHTETMSESGAGAGHNSALEPQFHFDHSQQSSHSCVPTYHTDATEDYVEQPTTTQCHNILTVFQASPLVWKDHSDHIHPVEDKMDFSREREIIIEAFSQSRTKVQAVFQTGTTEMLSDLLARGCRGEMCRVLHFSCHGGDECLYFEDGRGGAHVVPVEDLPDFIEAGGRTIDFVFIFACHSFLAGEAFLKAGARHVVCCRGDEKLRDNTVKVFCRAFYNALASAKTLKEAFELGKQAIKMSPHVLPHSEEEMKKLILLPENDASHHNVPVFSMNDERHSFSPSDAHKEEYMYHQSWIICHPPKEFIGREREIYDIIGALHRFRLVKLMGPPGVGKTSLAAAVCQYIKPRRKSFDVQEIIWLPLTQLSHEDKLTTSLLLLFELLQVKGIHDTSANGEYCKACHTIIGALQRTKAVIVVDTQFLDLDGLTMFLRDLLQRTEHVTIILIKNEASESSLSIGVAETMITVHPLSFRHSVMLFGALCPCMSGSHIASTPSDLWSILVSDDEDEYCAGDKRLSKRGEKVLQFIGEGVPAKVILAAEIVKIEWFNKLLDLCMLQPKDFTPCKMTELSELAAEMAESVKTRGAIKSSDTSNASSLSSLRETDESSLEDEYLLVGVDFSTAFRDMDKNWAKNIVRQRKVIDAHVNTLLERSCRFTDMEVEPCKIEVDYVEDNRIERAVVTLKMDIDIPSVGLDRLHRRMIQRCCQKIASLLRHAGVPDNELEQIMLGTLWQGSVNILLVAPSGVFKKLHSMIMDGEKEIDLGDDEYLVSVRPAFMIKPTSVSLGRTLRIDVLRSISGNAEEERDELEKGDGMFLVPTSPGASTNILTGVVALLGEKSERDWTDLLPFHYFKIGMCRVAAKEKGLAKAVEAAEPNEDVTSGAGVLGVVVPSLAGDSRHYFSNIISCVPVAASDVLSSLDRRALLPREDAAGRVVSTLLRRVFEKDGVASTVRSASSVPPAAAAGDQKTEISSAANKSGTTEEKTEIGSFVATSEEKTEFVSTEHGDATTEAMSLSLLSGTQVARGIISGGGSGDDRGSLSVPVDPTSFNTVISGISGIGKTTLAAMVVSRPDVLAHFCDGIAWLKLHQKCLAGGTSSVDNNRSSYEMYCSYLRSLCKQLDLTPPSFEWLDDDEPTSGQRIATLMDNARRDMINLLYGMTVLIVLDDVWHVSDVRWFSFANTPASNLRVLITTRIYPSGEAVSGSDRLTCGDDHIIRLGNLSEQEAVHLFISEAQIAAQKEWGAAPLEEALHHTTRVVKACNYHPVAIQSAARLLGPASSSEDVEQILKRFDADEITTSMP